MNPHDRRQQTTAMVLPVRLALALTFLATAISGPAVATAAAGYPGIRLATVATVLSLSAFLEHRPGR